VKLNRGGFPLRPGKQHCPSYLRTAFCPLMKAGDWTAGYPQHPKAAVCETFMRFGGCECVPLATSPRAAVSQLRACCLDTREPGFIDSVLDCAAIVCTCDRGTGG